MNAQLELLAPPRKIEVRVDGGEYEIICDTTRNYLSPKWFVHRVNDCANSKRFYSFPAGAATALFSGSIVWEK